MSNLTRVSVLEGSNKIRDGEMVIFPTETVYGLGANCENESAVKNIYICKNRPLNNPVLIHVCNLEMGKKYVKGLENVLTKHLIKKYWPGPLTIIGEATDLVPRCVTANTGMVGIRCPNHPLALELIEKSNCGIAAPSANISGHVSSTKVSHLFEDFNKCESNLFYIEDCEFDNLQKYGVESTIIKIERNCVLIYRYGSISKENLFVALQDYPFETHIRYKDQMKQSEVISPGQILKHYSPNLDTYLLNFNFAKTDIEVWIPDLSECILIDFNHNLISFKNDCLYYKDLSREGDTFQALENLYDILRYCEKIDGGKYILIYDLGDIKKENICCLYDKIYRASSGRKISIPKDSTSPLKNKCGRCC
tara:strand:+ start:1558 stop:2652 length:1095 start_codon:yes stop_codon:yes gene_type:complete